MTLMSYNDAAGVSAVITDSQRRLALGYPSSLILMPIPIKSTAIDSGNTPTTELRTGLLMGKITATGLYKDYDPTATDGSQFPIGPLWQERNMLDFSGTARAQNGVLVLGGMVDASNVLLLDARARQMLYGRIIFNDMIPGAAPGWFGPVAKAADYTVTAADSGYHFTTLGASGAVIFTLPTTLTAGWRALFTNEVNQNMTIAAPANKLVAFNNLTATSVAASTSGEKIGAGFEIYVNSSQTKYMVRTAHAGANTTTVA